MILMAAAATLLPGRGEYTIDMDRLELQITELAAQIHAGTYRLLNLIR